MSYFVTRPEDKVYRDTDIKVIKNTRVLLSSRNLMMSVSSRGAIAVSNLTWGQFYASSVESDKEQLEPVDEYQYRENCP